MLAFDVDALSFSVIGGTTDVEVTGRELGNTATDIVIPDTVMDSGTIYSATTIGDGAFGLQLIRRQILSAVKSPTALENFVKSSPTAAQFHVTLEQPVG